jgi:hypothetical protein
MSAYSVGDKCWYNGEAWRITRIWDTQTEGLRADLESLERVEISDSSSAQLSDIEGRIGDPSFWPETVKDSALEPEDNDS